MSAPKDRAELVAMIARSAFPSGWLPPIGDGEARTAEYRRAQAVAHTKAALAAIKAAGLHVVPSDPTPEMHQAGYAVVTSGYPATAAVLHAWSQMIAASPYAGKASVVTLKRGESEPSADLPGLNEEGMSP